MKLSYYSNATRPVPKILQHQMEHLFPKPWKKCGC